MQLHTVGINIFHVLINTPALLAQLHDIAHIFTGRHNACLYIGFFRIFQRCRVRIIEGVINIFLFPIGTLDFIDNAWCGGNQIEIIFPFQPFLYNFHMKQTKETAAETKAQCNGAFRLKGQRSVIELQLFQCITQIRIPGTVCGINTGKDHGLYLSVARQCFLCRILHTGDRITHTGICHIFDGSGKITDFTCNQTIRRRFQCQRTHITGFHHLELCTRSHHFHLHARLDTAFPDTDIDNDTTIGIILAVKNQSL